MILDLDDQFRSVYRFLWDLFENERAPSSPPSTRPGLRIEDKRFRQLTRPSIRLEQTIHREVDRGSGIKEDQVQYAITYYGVDRSDTTKAVSKMAHYLEFGGTDYSNRYLIPAWKFGWNFPQPVDVELSAGGTVPQGDHQIRVSGIDVCGNESAASLPTVVTVDGTQEMTIQIARVPWNHPLFPQYNVYVDGHLETNVQMPTWGYPMATISSLTGTGSPPLEASNPQGGLNAVRWKFLRVFTFASTVREDPVENGVFQSTTTMETSMIQARVLPQNPIMEYLSTTIDLMEDVAVSIP